MQLAKAMTIKKSPTTSNLPFHLASTPTMNYLQGVPVPDLGRGVFRGKNNSKNFGNKKRY